MKENTVSARLRNQSQMKSFRRTLRKHGTPAEGAFWRLVKNKQINGLVFRRQYSVGRYVLDFYCPKLRLCVELDGEGRFDRGRGELDMKRTDILQQYGITIQRFENKTIFDYPQEVVAWLTEFANQYLKENQKEKP